MHARPLRSAVVALTLAAVLTACGGATATGPPEQATVPTQGASTQAQVDQQPSQSAGLGAAAGPASAPSRTFAVGVRQLSLNRGASRPLPTTVWYPATGTAGGAAKTNAAAANGRFAVLLWSHGLTATPESYRQFTTRLAAAGFVVVAPAYPHTKRGAQPFNAGDLVNQPADGAHVITEVLKLDTRAGDPLAGHLDTARVGAAGHSAGGYTTGGMLTSTRDSRLRAAVIVAGGSLGGTFTGPSTGVLFIHGDADAVVPYSGARGMYGALRWPKAFLTLIGGDHGGYLGGSGPAAEATAKTTIDFLRFALYGDAPARARLAGIGTVAGLAKFESALGG